MKSYSKSIILLVAFLTTAVMVQAQTKVKGSGEVKSETRKLDSFKEMRVGGAYDVVIKKGSSNSVLVEADDNIINLIETKVSGDVLKVRTKSGYNIQNSTKMRLEVTYVELTNLDVSGACNLRAEGVVESDDFTVELSGAGKIEMEAKTKRFSADVSGAGTMKISGFTSNLNVDLSGASSFKGYDFEAENVNVHASGASSARVNCTNKVEAHGSGASSIRYKGKPKEKDAHKSGASSVEGIDD